MGREEIVVQSIVFPDNTCQEMELYFRINERVYFENEHINAFKWEINEGYIIAYS